VLHAMMRCGALGRAREPMITKAWAANSVASSIAWSRSRKKSGQSCGEKCAIQTGWHGTARQAGRRRR